MRVRANPQGRAWYMEAYDVFCMETDFFPFVSVLDFAGFRLRHQRFFKALKGSKLTQIHNIWKKSTRGDECSNDMISQTVTQSQNSHKKNELQPSDEFGLKMEILVTPQV